MKPKKKAEYDPKKIEDKWPQEKLSNKNNKESFSKGKQKKLVAYNPVKIEKKWQSEWLTKKTFEVKNNNGKKKMVLVEFPFPSGAGLHMGHMRPFIAGDVTTKYFKLKGFNAMYPIGWDAFGLPAENYAIKNKVHPSVSTKQNIANAKKQLLSWGTGYDWSREINTTDPEYYKWTQKLFLEFYKTGLAYEKFGEVNWCPKDKTGLANEEVIDGKCERCGTTVEKKNLRQWYMKITDYAEKLLEGLNDLPEWPHAVKVQQENWIGKSEGAEINFELRFKNEEDNKRRGPDGKPAHIPVFTTRADTLFGVTYLVLAPEHLWVTLATDDNHDVLENKNEVKKYLEQVKAKTDIERSALDKEKTGVELKGVKAINPANGEVIPMFVADYVLGGYGTGAIMAVPAHDERDFEFAKKYNLPIKEVIAPHFTDWTNPPQPGKKVIRRKTIHAIIENVEGDKVIGIKWKKYNWQTFVIGGVEEGEDVIEGAKREAMEETGYIDLEFVKILGDEIHSEYFATHKDVNRYADVTGVVFRMRSESRNELSEEESDKHEILWIEKNKIRDFYKGAEVHVLIDRYFGIEKPFIGHGEIKNSDKFDGLKSEVIKTKIVESVGGKIVTKYKLRDWVFSRQRYWGEPIPLIHCPKCGIVPVADKDLPVKLPEVKNYEPTGTGESPLAAIDKWVNVKCPKCKGKAKRETNTMPQWAGSSWYWLRYMDAKNKKEVSSLKAQKYWSPVDLYFGGMEHTTLHLLYSRFWNLFLYDRKLVTVKEPYKKRVPHGIILGPDGEKMSKSRGNVVNPDDVIKIYGADTTRLYMMFLGPHGAQVAWNDKGIVGTRRFLERVWAMQDFVSKKEADDVTAALHKTIKKVGEDIETFSFNTAVSSMMIFVNTVYESKSVTKKSYESFLTLLSVFAPHMTEEIWRNLGNKQTIFKGKWPTFKESYLKSEKVTVVVQVNGKIKAELSIDRDIDDEAAKTLALENPKVVEFVGQSEIKRVIVVKNRLINIVI
ncbi:MAG: leucyl-tRNA synthetase [Candidatus Taylorbacteria bacterium]|nr:leucyl-tRNA synthetase [Candidatus Taylorbacteria bacterium]